MDFPEGGCPHSSTAMDIFSLPRVTRDDIYRRALALGHPIYLFQEAGSSVVAIFARQTDQYTGSHCCIPTRRYTTRLGQSSIV